MVSALLSLNLASEEGKTLVSIGIYKTDKGEWHNSTGQDITYFNWLEGEPDDLVGNYNYAGFPIGGVNGSAKWTDYRGSDMLNVICTKTVGQGKNNKFINQISLGKTSIHNEERYNCPTNKKCCFALLLTLLTKHFQRIRKAKKSN